MIKAIEQAHESIYIEMYIFLDDTTESHDFIGKLFKKLKGVLKLLLSLMLLEATKLEKKLYSAYANPELNLFFLAIGYDISIEKF